MQALGDGHAFSSVPRPTLLLVNELAYQGLKMAQDSFRSHRKSEHHAVSLPSSVIVIKTRSLGAFILRCALDLCSL